MPLRNRVAPTGEIFADPARGTIMGNRGGVLHDDHRQIVRPYAGRRWLICLLEFKGRKRVVMTPRRYTELFFLDEAVALAAGHRPCAECRRERFNAFREAWVRSHFPCDGGLPPVDVIDREIHAARVGHGRVKVTYSAPLDRLPDGAFVLIEGSAYLVLGESLFRWTAGGYVDRRPRFVLAGDHREAEVLTPRPIVECLRSGYAPSIHASARI